MPAGESEAKAKTKAQFEEVFKSYSGSAVEKKKSKRKSTPSQDSIVLETLRNKLGLHKDNEDDETILNNTYNQEEQSPRFSKNKLNDRTSVAEKVNNDELREDEKKPQKNKKKKKKSIIGEQPFDEEDLYKAAIPESVTTLQKSKKMRSKSTLGEEDHVDNVLKNDLGEDVDSLIHAYQQHIDVRGGKKKTKKIKERSLETISHVSSILNKKLDKKKRQKKSLPTDERETSEMCLSELQDSQDETNRKGKKISHRRLMSESELEVISDDEKQRHGEEEKQQKAKRKTKKTKKGAKIVQVKFHLKRDFRAVI